MLHSVDIHFRSCLCMVVTFPHVSSTFASSLVSELSLGRASIRCSDSQHGRGRHVYFILYSRFVPILCIRCLRQWSWIHDVCSVSVTVRTVCCLASTSTVRLRHQVYPLRRPQLWCHLCHSEGWILHLQESRPLVICKYYNLYIYSINDNILYL